MFNDFIINEKPWIFIINVGIFELKKMIIDLLVDSIDQEIKLFDVYETNSLSIDISITSHYLADHSILPSLPIARTDPECLAMCWHA